MAQFTDASLSINVSINCMQYNIWWLKLSTDNEVIGKFDIQTDTSIPLMSAQAEREHVCFASLCFAATSTAGNNTIQVRLKLSQNQSSRVKLSSHWHLTHKLTMIQHF